MHTSKKEPLSNPELSAFSGQLAMILKAGISSLEGISMMLEDSEDEAEKEILTQILEGLQTRGELFPAMEAAGLFPPYFLKMVQLGEETGNLDTVFESLSTHYEREDSISTTIKNAITYPLIMGFMMIAVILVLLIKVMPIFQQVFIQLGSEMTGFSLALMNLGNTLNRYALFLVILLVILFGAIFFLAGTASGRSISKGVLTHLPAFRRMQDEICACRFASVMSLTLASGMNPERCLELAGDLIQEDAFRQKLDACKDLVKQGEDLTKAFTACAIFSGSASKLASIGYRTGSMDQAMEQIAAMYQERIDGRINHTLAVLEPTLVISLSIIVGAILLSVMLPLTGIMSGI